MAKKRRSTRKRTKRKVVRRKKPRSAAQKRATAKGTAALKKYWAKKKRKSKKNPVRRRKVGAQTKRVAAKRGPYFIKRGVRWFDGAGFTRDKASAASYASLAACKRIASKIANKTGGNVAIYG